MAQHVTFWRMKVQPGKLGELRALMDARGSEAARLKATGWVQTVVGERKDAADEIWGAVTWDNSDNYYKNAAAPEQDEWYRKLRSLLVSDPEWFDCNVIAEERA